MVGAVGKFQARKDRADALSCRHLHTCRLETPAFRRGQGLLSIPIHATLSPVKAKTISFEQLQRDKRRERLRDERRLARGEVTPEQLQRENSLFSPDAPVEIPKLWETLRAHYAK